MNRLLGRWKAGTFPCLVQPFSSTHRTSQEAPGDEQTDGGPRSGWRIFIQQQGCLGGQTLLQLCPTALLHTQGLWPWAEGGHDHGGQGTARAWTGVGVAEAWAGADEESSVGSGPLRPSQRQPVQATFSHSSQLSSAMVPGQGKKTGQLTLNLKRLWSWELLARPPEQACFGEARGKGLASFSPMRSMKF